ncbi:hypothetical protein J6590_062170 [Homalodisca vitripennis]|nr:hypothetical protein J6590_062170 [Homalodisca vitripennis]
MRGMGMVRMSALPSPLSRTSIERQGLKRRPAPLPAKAGVTTPAGTALGESGSTPPSPLSHASTERQGLKRRPAPLLASQALSSLHHSLAPPTQGWFEATDI